MRSKLTKALGMMVGLISAPAMADGIKLDRQANSFRIASFNADLNRKGAGVLIKDIRARRPQVLAVVEIILRTRPDLILLNEIDHDPEGLALADLKALLAEGVGDVAGIDFAHSFLAPSNTGVPSGLDLDKDGRIAGPGDALGFGRFPGQYGMAVLSQVPLDEARTFQNFKWSDIPWVEAPTTPNGKPYYSEAAWARLPLSSKSHWDVPAKLPDGRVLHLLASHPTPPVFDGPENRNGLRNAAEIRFWADYVDGAEWVVDDKGTAGGLPEDAHFVVAGDLNNDPEKGDGNDAAIRSLTLHARINDTRPTSPGAAALGDASDTADWPEDKGPGNLRVDYVLPSRSLAITGSGVFWPAKGDPLGKLVEIRGRKRASSDHRLVWVDIKLEN